MTTVEIYADDYVDKIARWLIDTHPLIASMAWQHGGNSPFTIDFVTSVMRKYPEPVDYPVELAKQVSNWLHHNKIAGLPECFFHLFPKA